MHLTDADKFWIADEKVYYQKYDHFGESGNDLYCTDLEMTKEQKIAENAELLTIDQESQKMIVEKNGNLLAYSMNGQESRVLFDPKEAMDWEIRENDHITFSEVNVIGEELYAKIQLWRYEEGNGWRDSLVEEKYLKISINSGEYQEWDPASLLADRETDGEIQNNL